MEKASRVEEPLTDRLDGAWQDALAALAADGRREPAAILAAPALPADFAAFLARALAEPEARPGEHEALKSYHLEMLQGMRAGVLATSDEPLRTLMHTPLDLAAMPRLRTALAAFFARVAAAGVAPERAFGAASPAALVAARPTFAALFAGAYYGSYGPPLYTSPADVAACARDLGSGSEPSAVIDRRLAAPLVHELSHLQKERAPLSPPYLDECVSAWLGEQAMPGIALPADADDDGALYLAGWFTQVGAHLALVADGGPDALVRAHAGVASWDDVLPPGLAATYARLGWEQWRAGRQPHFLGETSHPDPWIKAAWLAAAGLLPRDVATLAEVDALPWPRPARAPTPGEEALVAYARRILTTAPERSPEGAWRVTTRPTATAIDAASCRMTRVGVVHPLEVTPLYVIVPPTAAVDVA